MTLPRKLLHAALLVLLLILPGGFLLAALYGLWCTRKNYQKCKKIGQVSTFHAMKNYAKFLRGGITLDQYRASRADVEVHPLYSSNKKD